MPLQNRVDPFGAIVAISARGTMMGNRGIIHNPATRTLLPRRWTTKAWIVCLCEYKGRRRVPMAQRSWTELFFLDEATAFAAGHRPCFYCRREDAEAFRAAWAAGNGLANVRASEIDAGLHHERLDGKQKRLHPLPVAVKELPDGAMIAADDDCFVVTSGKALRWSFDGYRHESNALGGIVRLLTPPSTLRAMRAGYLPQIDPSAALP